MRLGVPGEIGLLIEQVKTPTPAAPSPAEARGPKPMRWLERVRSSVAPAERPARTQLGVGFHVGVVGSPTGPSVWVRGR